MKKTIFILTMFVLIGPVFAHQPRIGFETGTLENPIEIAKPEVSKAYYSELRGEPEYYVIHSNHDFLLYLNTLAPDIKGARTDFFVETLYQGEVLYTLGSDDWQEFYEPFGGDHYLQGPELEHRVGKGTYLIKVSNPDNAGKYALAVGKIESFPPMEILKTFIALPKLKRDFFGKSPFTAYFNYSGLFLLLVLIVLATIVFIGARLTRKRHREKS